MDIQKIILLFSILCSQAFAQSQNLLPNGDFENDLDGWTPQGTVSISTSVVQGGAKSLMANNPDTLEYSYAWQEFSLDYEEHEINFWIFPQSTDYWNTFQMIAGWNTPGLVFVTRIHFQEDVMTFVAVDQSESISNVLTPNSWNKVTVQVNKAALTQDFFVNGAHVSSLTASSFPTVEHIMTGDLSITGHFGTVYFDEISITDSLTTQIESPDVLPDRLALHQNYPNPFNPATTISYEIAEPGPVRLQVFNLRGQLIKTLVNEFLLAGSHRIEWDATGHGSGVYVFTISSDGTSVVRKGILLK